jgi:hypothetical protein
MVIAPVFAQSQTPIQKDWPSSANPCAAPTPKARQPIIEATDPRGRLYWIPLATDSNRLFPVGEKGTPELPPLR